MDFKQLVKEMREKEESLSTKEIEDIIDKARTFTEKCILIKKYLTPQSAITEKIIKKDLKMENKINQTSGDARKNSNNYEIKYSGHAKKSMWNFVQIRPDHDVQDYVLLGYNMYDESDKDIGKGYVFKVPAEKMYNLVINYGGYAHGTVGKLGKITKDNIKGRNCEYALRCDPNSKQGKNKEIFDELLKYEITYSDSHF
jgi:hypothetical protein